jgi:archaellum component FlaC
LFERIEKLENNIADIPEANLSKIREFKEELSILKIDIKDVKHTMTILNEKIYHLESELQFLRSINIDFPKYIKILVGGMCSFIIGSLAIEVIKVFKK